MSPCKSETFDLSPDKTPGSGLNSPDKKAIQVFKVGYDDNIEPFNPFSASKGPQETVSRRSALKEIGIQSSSVKGSGATPQDEEAKTFRSPRLNVK